MTQKNRKCEDKKGPGGGEFALTLRYRRAKNPSKNDTKKPQMGGQKSPRRGENSRLLSPIIGQKNLKNDTKIPCIFTRKCHKAGVWVIKNFLTRSFIFSILWRFCLS